MPNIREASIEDVGEINRVSAFLGYSPMSRAESKKCVQDLLDSNTDVIWVCEDNARIVGWIHVFVALRLASHPFAEIGGLVVDESCRRSGIGKRLVETAMQWAGQQKLSLRVRCNSERQEANRFYRHLGFDVQKTQIVYEKCSS